MPAIKRCRKCGTTKEPAIRRYQKTFEGGFCTVGTCPAGEHLHLTCECGFMGIAPCADASELGEVQTTEPVSERSRLSKFKRTFGFG